MLKRFYADNFRCLTNFELELEEANVFLGTNGTGKSSVFTVLRKIQGLVVHGDRVDDVFAARDLALGQNLKEQRFELDISTDEHTYRYGLTIEHDRDRNQMRISRETLEHDGKIIFEFDNGMVQLYHDDYAAGPSYPFDWTLSGIGALYERNDNRKLTQFKKELGNYVIVGVNPSMFSAETRTEDDFLDPLMENFVSWYRHYSQENMRSIGTLFAALGNSLPSFDSIRLKESGENARVFKAAFLSTTSNKPVEYGLDQLSDGQRALIALYSLILLTDDRRVSLFIDEPDNYLALREVQPWLAEAAGRCGGSLEQITVISHHPVTIDYLAGAHGRWFFRNGDGPARVGEEPAAPDGMTLSETIARGWEDERENSTTLRG